MITDITLRAADLVGKKNAKLVNDRLMSSRDDWAHYADDLLRYSWLKSGERPPNNARVLLKTRNFRGMYGLLQRTHRAHVRLTSHSAIFQLILLALAFYILSSGGSLFGSALVMAMNLHLLKDEWADFLKGKKEALVDWLFWQIKGVAMERYLRLYLWGPTAVFLLLSLILI